MNYSNSDNDNDSVTSSSNQEDLKQTHDALHFSIGNMCNPNSNNPLSISLTAQSHSQKKPIISKKGMEALTQLTFEYSQLLSRDLVAFSKHANRKTITVEDVKLCLRRNENMLKKLETHLERQKEDREMEMRYGEGLEFMDQIVNRNVNHEMNPDTAKHSSDLDSSSDEDNEIDFAVRKSSESDTLFDMHVDSSSSASSSLDSSDEEDALTKRSKQIKSSRLKMSSKNDSDSDDDFKEKLEKSKKGHESVMKAKTSSLNAIELSDDSD